MTETVTEAPMLTVMHALRRERQISQMALSELTGIAQPTISWIERGGVGPKHHLEILAKYFGIGVDDVQREFTEYVQDGGEKR